MAKKVNPVDFKSARVIAHTSSSGKLVYIGRVLSVNRGNDNMVRIRTSEGIRRIGLQFVSSIDELGPAVVGDRSTIFEGDVIRSVNYSYGSYTVSYEIAGLTFSWAGFGSRIGLLGLVKKWVPAAKKVMITSMQPVNINSSLRRG